MLRVELACALPELGVDSDPVDAMVTEVVFTRLSAVDVHGLIAPQEDEAIDREALLHDSTCPCNNEPQPWTCRQRGFASDVGS